jgi:hypothetical protein
MNTSGVSVTRSSEQRECIGRPDLSDLSDSSCPFSSSLSLEMIIRLWITLVQSNAAWDVVVGLSDSLRQTR